MTRFAILALVLATGCTQPLPPSGKRWVERCVAANGSMDIARVQCDRAYRKAHP